MPDVTIKGISSVPPFAATATFKGTETVGGKLSDHYSYTRAGDPYTETGDVWLNAGVPFGVVKQTTTTTDAAGKVMWTTESLLVSSGSKPVPAATTTATAPASMTLQAAYAAGLVVINVEIAASDKRGDRMQFVLETAEKSLTVTMPAAATTLLVESPFATLAFRPATAQTFVLTPEKPATVAVNQLGEDRIVAGKFAISKFEGRPIFGGVITTGTVK
jgi:hypothetical protein